MTRFKSKNPTEYQEQVKLAKYLDMKGYCWCHVPNGGNRDAKTGAKMKRQGVKPGVPDVLIFDEPKAIKEMIGNRISKYKGVVIELKRQNGGRVRETQEEWLRKFDDRGWATNVCHGADEAITWLEIIFEGDRR